MASQGMYTISSNRPIARDVYEMILLGDTGALHSPGQFVNIRLEGLFLRRPISICRYEEGRMTLIYKVIGKGTAHMAAMEPGQTLDLLVGLGNGFDPAPAKGKNIALIGGGVGLPPLVGLLEALKGEHVHVVAGFAAGADAFYQEELLALGAAVTYCTADGSLGEKGFVTHALAHIPYDYYFACGPKAMLQAVHALGKKGQLSFEERMGCGFGACMGCTCKTKEGHKRICMEGPVLRSEEVMF